MLDKTRKMIKCQLQCIPLYLNFVTLRIHVLNSSNINIEKTKERYATIAYTLQSFNLFSFWSG